MTRMELAHAHTNYHYDNHTCILFLVSAEAMLDQERMWEETLADDSATECEARHGGPVPTIIDPQMMHDIQVLVSRLVVKARQLIGNYTTNLVEGWMQIRCKFDGGKVVNRSQSGSWEHRCYGAGLQQNLGRSWGPPTWETMTSSPPNQVFIDTAESSAKKVETTRKRKATEKAKESRRRSKYSRSDNSGAAHKAYNRHDNDIEPDDITDDISSEYFDELKNAFYTTQVAVTMEQVYNTEQETREQSGNDLWIRERTKRITASRVGGILKMKKTTKRSRKVEEILYTKFKGNQATLYGTNMEDTARREYVTYRNQNGHVGLVTHRVGLVISIDNPWLASSPDDKVYDPTATQTLGVAEYKNPYIARDLTLQEASDKTKQFCLERQEEKGQVTYKLKRRHDYYYQIQCQMYCCNVEWCDFVLRTNKDLHVERIFRDPDWWKQQLPRLKHFYFDAFLPELACPRRGKGGVREPATVSET